MLLPLFREGLAARPACPGVDAVRLLDLFCGGGGGAMGYNRAGFTEIVGVDNRPMPRYPFTFVQADALEYVAEHGREFDAIHASPPCQHYTRLRHLPWLKVTSSRGIKASRSSSNF